MSSSQDDDDFFHAAAAAPDAAADAAADYQAYLAAVRAAAVEANTVLQDEIAAGVAAAIVEQSGIENLRTTLNNVVSDNKIDIIMLLLLRLYKADENEWNIEKCSRLIDEIALLAQQENGSDEVQRVIEGMCFFANVPVGNPHTLKVKKIREACIFLLGVGVSLATLRSLAPDTSRDVLLTMLQYANYLYSALIGQYVAPVQAAASSGMITSDLIAVSFFRAINGGSRLAACVAASAAAGASSAAAGASSAASGAVVATKDLASNLFITTLSGAANMVKNCLTGVATVVCTVAEQFTLDALNLTSKLLAGSAAGDAANRALPVVIDATIMGKWDELIARQFYNGAARQGARSILVSAGQSLSNVVDEGSQVTISAIQQAFVDFNMINIQITTLDRNRVLQCREETLPNASIDPEDIQRNMTERLNRIILYITSEHVIPLGELIADLSYPGDIATRMQWLAEKYMIDESNLPDFIALVSIWELVSNKRNSTFTMSQGSISSYGEGRSLALPKNVSALQRKPEDFTGIISKFLRIFQPSEQSADYQRPDRRYMGLPSRVSSNGTDLRRTFSSAGQLERAPFQLKRYPRLVRPERPFNYEFTLSNPCPDRLTLFERTVLKEDYSGRSIYTAMIDMSKEGNDINEDKLKNLVQSAVKAMYTDATSHPDVCITSENANEKLAQENIKNAADAVRRMLQLRPITGDQQQVDERRLSRVLPGKGVKVTQFDFEPLSAAASSTGYTAMMPTVTEELRSQSADPSRNYGSQTGVASGLRPISASIGPGVFGKPLNEVRPYVKRKDQATPTGTSTSPSQAPSTDVFTGRRGGKSTRNIRRRPTAKRRVNKKRKTRKGKKRRYTKKRR